MAATCKWLEPVIDLLCVGVNQLFYAVCLPLLKVELAGQILGRGIGSHRGVAKLLVLYFLLFFALYS
jgi:hypothetical protein